MIPLRESLVLDRNAEAAGMSVATLVENAARALHAEVAPRASGKSVLVLAGPGNNGADGLALARLLAQDGVAVEVLAAGAWKSAEAKRAADALPPQVQVQPSPARSVLDAALTRAGVVVDALLGAGSHGPLRAPYDEWVEAMRPHAWKTVSVDVPTGFGTPTALRPSTTITFHDVKDGMTEATCGRIVVAPIGIPEEASLYTGPGEYALYPLAKWDQHKGEGGIVLIVGGGPYTGAPAVAGLAALRAGADLAIVLTPERSWQSIASYSPNLVVRPLNGQDLNLDDPANRVTLNTWIKKARSVVVGPGLGLMSPAQKGVHHLLQRAAQEGVPVVIDADAITAIAERKDLLTPLSVVTPHAREFRTLTGKDLPPEAVKRVGVVQEAARQHGATWLLKGPVDVIADAKRAKLNATGHPAMSVGGSGDALAGVVGALLAKGMPPFDAARLGARINGEAGEEAAAAKSWGLLATDIVEAIPAVLARNLPIEAKGVRRKA